MLVNKLRACECLSESINAELNASERANLISASELNPSRKLSSFAFNSAICQQIMQFVSEIRCPVGRPLLVPFHPYFSMCYNIYTQYD